MFEVFSSIEVSNYGYHVSGILFIITVILFWKTLYKPELPSPKMSMKYCLLLILVFLFVLTPAYANDFYGYMILVKTYESGLENFHLEKIYEYIIIFVKNNYLFFRVIVWGGALLIYIVLVDLYKLCPIKGLFFLFLLFIPIFAYARATLAMSCYYLGLSIFLLKPKGIMKYCGLVILLFSYAFHKSMLLMITLVPFCFSPLTKKSLILYLSFAVLIGLGIDNYINEFLFSLSNSEDTQLSDKVTYLVENSTRRESSNRNLFGWASVIWSYMVFYYPFYVVSKIIIGKHSPYIPQHINRLYRLTFMVVLLSTMMLIFSDHSLTYFYRYLYMSMIPLSVLCIFLVQNSIMSLRDFRKILYICGTYNIYTFFFYIFR